MFINASSVKSILRANTSVEGPRLATNTLPKHAPGLQTRRFSTLVHFTRVQCKKLLMEPIFPCRFNVHICLFHFFRLLLLHPRKSLSLCAYNLIVSISDQFLFFLQGNQQNACWKTSKSVTVSMREHELVGSCQCHQDTSSVLTCTCNCPLSSVLYCQKRTVAT